LTGQINGAGGIRRRNHRRLICHGQPDPASVSLRGQVTAVTALAPGKVYVGRSFADGSISVRTVSSEPPKRASTSVPSMSAQPAEHAASLASDRQAYYAPSPRGARVT
jgi:hypothetical protein